MIERPNCGKLIWEQAKKRGGGEGIKIVNLICD